MNYKILLLTISLLSCGEHQEAVKAKSSDTKPVVVDDEAALFAEKKASLDQLFLLNRDSAKFTSQDMWGSLLIGHLFDNTQKDAVLRYKDNDTVANIIVLRQSGKNWDTIFSTKIWPVETVVWDEFIEVADFNGDNIPDLKIIKNFWYYHTGENADLWLYSKDHFTKVEGFDSIVSATYDKQTNLIYSYQSNGCADMAMYFGVFKVVGNKVVKIKEMNCNCCLETGDSCSIEVFGQKPHLVPYKKAYKYVPAFYAEGVKDKCEMVPLNNQINK